MGIFLHLNISRQWINRLTFVAIALFALGLCILFRPIETQLTLSSNQYGLFKPQTIQAKIFRLFDLGVTDVNGDNRLDIYTSNHSNEQYLFLGQGNGTFSKNQIEAWNLNQDPEFPGLEYSLSADQNKAIQPGLYIYWTDRRLNLVAHKLETPDLIKGTFTVSAPLTIEKQSGVSLERQTIQVGNGETGTKLTFQIKQSNGKATFLPGNVALPFVFELAPQVPLNSVFVGHKHVSPPATRFDLFMQDRHGMAWTDMNQDNKLDVFIVRGALKGRIENLPGSFNDEQLVQNNTGQGFQNVVQDSKYDKKDCPGVQTAWTDVNNDNRLDLFTLCYKPTNPIQTYPPQLFIQDETGQLREKASDARLDLKEDGSFFWLDIDDDGDSDLFRTTSEQFWLYQNNSGQFTPKNIGKNPGSVAKTFDGSNNITVADFDIDGDLDIFTASPQGNALLINQSSTLTLTTPSAIGLPKASLTAHWVDVDNDGRVDLYTLPQGLFKQQTPDKFITTKALSNQSAQGILEARATWFDANNDGFRDLLTTLNFRAPLYQKLLEKGLGLPITPIGWIMNLYEAPANNNHWLSIDLRGNQPNPQAIGAKVDVTSALGTQRYGVGQSEGAHFSQGHYRLYLGLGSQTKPIQIKVYWPDGSTQTLETDQFDRHLILTQNDATKK